MRSRLVPILIVAVIAAAAVIAAVTAKPASSYPSKQSACTGCHPAAPAGASVSAVPSTTTPQPGATYSVTVNLSGLTSSGDTGYWISNNGSGTPVVSVYGGDTGTNQTTYTQAMTAPSTPGTYSYLVWCNRGSRSSGQAKSTTYSITVPSGTPTPTPTPTSTPTSTPSPTPTPTTSSTPVPVDTTPPVTTTGGMTGGAWYNGPVNVPLHATDNQGGMGVASITYSVDGGTPLTVQGAAATAVIPVDAVTHVADGPHTVTYFATDAAKVVETAHALTVNVDTQKPSTKARAAASVRRGRRANLKFEVLDTAPNGGKAKVTILIRDRRGVVVKRLRLGERPVNKALAAKFRCKLQAGTYRFAVKATDAAGNKQRNIAVQSLVVHH